MAFCENPKSVKAYFVGGSINFSSKHLNYIKEHLGYIFYAKGKNVYEHPS